MSEHPGGNGPGGGEGRGRQEMLTGAAGALQALIMWSSGASLETLRHGAQCHVAEVTGFAVPLPPPPPPATRRRVWKPLLLPSLSQVPCYAFDRGLKKHDLNPLIKTSGAYLVDDSDPDTSLFINVCRDIGLCLRASGVGVGERLLQRLQCLCPSTVGFPWLRD